MSKLLTVTAFACTAILAMSARAQEGENGGASEEIRAKEVSAPEEKPTIAPANDQSPTERVAGKIGLGYFTGGAPLGLRYWLDANAAVDANVGFGFSSGDNEALRLALDLGYVMRLAHAGQGVVFARAGLGYQFIDSFASDASRSGAAQHDLNLSLFLGAELFLTQFGFPNISLQGGYGVAAQYTYRGGGAFVLSDSNAGLNVVGTGNLGFHIYF